MAEAYTTTENEAFLRMKEDPLMLIKMKEQEQRQAIINNPMTLKKIRQEIELLKNGGNKKDKKSKKSKKEKKEKKHRHRSSSSDSRHRHRRHSRSRSRERDIRSREEPKINHTKREDRTKNEEDVRASTLGPDMALYRQRLQEIKKTEELRKQ